MLSTKSDDAPAAALPDGAESEDEKLIKAFITRNVSERRVLRSHYRRLKASIAESKDKFLSAGLDKFEEMVCRVDELYSLVNRPREQIVDAEALLQVTEAFLKSVKDECHGGAAKAAMFVSMLIHNFNRQSSIIIDDSCEAVSMDWAALGHEAITIFHDVPGISTMLGPIDNEPKRRELVPGRGPRRLTAETVVHPQVVGGAEEQSSTNRNIRTMLNILRQFGERGCELEQLVLSRESFSHTVENIFCLSFLVKDGIVQISIEDQKHIVACKHAASTAMERSARADRSANSQFVFRFDIKDWILMKDYVEAGKEVMPSCNNPPERSQEDASSHQLHDRFL